MVKFKFGQDANGNRTIKITRPGKRGFSIQTNGNLPQTHAMSKDSLNAHIVHDECRAYCGIYGTKNQRNILA